MRSRPGRGGRETVKSDRFSFSAFASLGTRGFRSHNTVSRYWKAWKDERGGDPDVLMATYTRDDLPDKLFLVAPSAR